VNRIVAALLLAWLLRLAIDGIIDG